MCVFQGLIDAEKEISKLSVKRGELQKQLEKLAERMGKADYRDKVPQKVQEGDAEKVRLRERDRQRLSQ